MQIKVLPIWCTRFHACQAAALWCSGVWALCRHVIVCGYIRAGSQPGVTRNKKRSGPGSALQTLAMVSKKAAAGLLLVYVMAVLAEQAEGFVPFFTQSDIQKMQEKERIKGQKKSLTSLQQLEEEGFSEQSGADIEGMKTIQLAVPVRAGTWLILRQLEKYQGVLEKLLTEVLQDTPNAD
uniref:Promotilin n=2 Tax=Meleagris gallopavo TaxID=9103 RepID=A0A803Y2K5_MELGA